jgi:hypothetical protein
MVQHTFLFQEGLWIAGGAYFDDRDNALPLEGKTRVTHLEGLWINEGAMELKSGAGALIIHNRYEIIPFPEGGAVTAWKSSNPAAGLLLGRFVIVENAILSACRSEKGDFSGSEFLLKINDAHYVNRGVFLRGDAKLSSWAVELKRVKDGPFPESL